jgi:hypothetical protein
MKKYPYDTKLQGSACYVMVEQVEVGKYDIQAAPVIIGAMLRHKDDFSVQKGGCGALCNLTWLHPEHKKELVMAGPARVMAAASEKIWDESAELIDWARRFFIALFDEGSQY